MIVNTRIGLSLISILAAAAMMAGATFALFTDAASSQDNTFSTGNADLQIANDIVPPGDPDVYANDITGVSISSLLPDQSITKDFWLKNNSSGDFSMDTTVDLGDLTGTVEGTLPNELMVMFQCDTNSNGLGDGDSSTSNKSVSDWITEDPEQLGTIGANDGPSDATTQSDQDELLCRMTANLPDDVENDVAGETLSFDGIFDAIQAH